MAYLALYRKYRPRIFSDVVGQDHITQTLRREVATERLSHAYLFVGTRGKGKTTCAKILASAVNCENPQNGEPCGQCYSCKSISDGSATDVLEIDAASNNGVDSVRALAEEMAYLPAALKKRVYILDEAHMLSQAAWNALLKIIEEPPDHLMFVFATTDAHKVPATILSRCQRFEFRRLSSEIIRKRLEYVAESENIALESEAAALLARLADGAMRDGLSLLDQCAGTGTVTENGVRAVTGLSDREEAFTLLRALLRRDRDAAFAAVDSVYSKGRLIDALFEETAQIARDAMVYGLTSKIYESLSGGGTSETELAALNKIAGKDRVRFILGAVNEARAGFTRGVGDRIAADFAIAAMLSDKYDDSAIIERINLLETKLENAPAPDYTLRAPEAPYPAPIQPQQPPETPRPNAAASIISAGAQPAAREDDDTPPDRAHTPTDTAPAQTPKADPDSVGAKWANILNAIREKKRFDLYTWVDAAKVALKNNILSVYIDKNSVDIIKDSETQEDIEEFCSAELKKPVTIIFRDINDFAGGGSAGAEDVSPAAEPEDTLEDLDKRLAEFGFGD